MALVVLRGMMRKDDDDNEGEGRFRNFFRGVHHYGVE